MKVLVGIEGREVELDFTWTGETVRFERASEGERQADVRECEPGVYSVLLDGRSFEARVEPGVTGLVVVVEGHRLEVAVRDPRRWNRQSAGTGAEGRQTVVAPMPGKVVRVLVRPDDRVEAGQGLLVVEAMKMQNEMRSAKSGKVVSLAVEEGATVAAGQVLATIE